MRGRNSIPQRRGWTGAVIAVLALYASAVAGGQASTPVDRPSPGELVRVTIANEVAAAKDTSIRHAFRSRKQYAHGSQTKLYVETKEGMAGMVIAYDDHPLTPEQLQGEESHLDGLQHDPELLARKQAKEKEDAERTIRIVRALPDAFSYEYADSEAAADGKFAQVVHLKFKPNPDYSPPSRVEQVLTGMSGDVLIDQRSHRLMKIDGTLFKEVSFGWSILGHLNEGGHFLVEQADAGDGTWEMTHMSLRFTGKILLFKNLNIESDEVFSSFRRIPSDTSFAQGVDMLKDEQSKLAKNGADPAK